MRDYLLLDGPLARTVREAAPGRPPAELRIEINFSEPDALDRVFTPTEQSAVCPGVNAFAYYRLTGANEQHFLYNCWGIDDN